MSVHDMDIAGLIGAGGHSVSVERAEISEDDAGGRERTWAAVGSALSAWVQPASARTVEAYGRRGMRDALGVLRRGPGARRRRQAGLRREEVCG